MKKIFLRIITTTLLCSQFIGCMNYKEINRITFVTSVIFDRDEYNNVKIYLDCVAPYRNTNESSDKGRRIVFEGNGKTALEAMRNVSAESSNELDFSQVRAYIFSEEAAINGLEKYIELIQNNQELGYKTYMFAYFGEVESLLKVKNNDEEYLGLYLNDLVEMNKKNCQVISSNVSDYLTSSTAAPNIGVMSAIEVDQEAMDEKVLLNGAIVTKNNQMVGRIEEKDTLNYNLLLSKSNQGSFQVANPNEKDKYITLDILNTHNSMKVYIDGDNVILKPYVKVNTSIGEVEGKLNIDNSVIQLLRKEEEQKLSDSFKKYFKEFKDMDVDVLEVEKLVKQKYPKYDTKDILSKTKIEPKVNILIDGRSLIKDNK